MANEKLLLIDGHSILSRAFYGVPELSNSKGQHINGIFGFVNILLKMLEEEGADHLAVAFDLPKPTFRHEMFDGYKGTRKPMPPELLEQVPLVQELLKSMNIPILTLEGYEADDILGTVAKRMQAAGHEVTIVSGDRDLLQLADAHIRIALPKTVKGQTETTRYTPAEVEVEWGVTPQEFIDLKALMGDSSDNIPGVPGMGPKTAQWIIQHYHSIENAYAHTEDPDFKVPRKPKAAQMLKDNWDNAVLSKTLATICTEAPLDLSFEEAEVTDLFNAEARKLLGELELRSLLKRFEEANVGEAEEAAGLDISVCRDCTDPYMARIVFKDAANAGKAGFVLTEAGLYVALSRERLYFMHDFDCLSELSALFGKCTLYTMDLKRQLHLGLLPENAGIEDISLAAYLVNPLSGSYDYAALAQTYLSVTLPEAKKLEKPEEAGMYTALTALLAGEAVLARLKEMEMEALYREIELPLIYTLFEMEEAGVLVDRDALLSYGGELRAGIETLREKIYAACGEEFNINSPQQLGRILFEKLGLPGGKKTKTGYSTAADVLEKLAEEHAVVDDILQYRTLSKLNSTYAEGLLSFISEDGRIHGSFNQMVTATGRLSSTEPNLQNIPIRTELGRRFRRVFIPKPGCVFLDADYSQVELRILASLSGDEQLIAAYQHADDIHAVTASQVFHVPLSEVTPQLRRNAKAVNFGIVYGISAFGLSEGLSISRKEAKSYIERYFETYPGVKAYLDGEVAYAREHGYVKTIFGRRRPIPEINASNFMRRSFGERVAMNSPIQGAAADIMKKAMNEVRAALKAEGLQSRIVLQVHDELLLEVPEAEADRVEKLLTEKMQQAVQLRVELVADAKRGTNWEEAH